MTGLATEEATERSVALRAALAERLVLGSIGPGTKLPTLGTLDQEDGTDAGTS